MGKGSVMLITDYFNATGYCPLNPYIGQKQYFPNQYFDPRICFEKGLLDFASKIMDECQNELNKEVNNRKIFFKGIYTMCSGPTYETCHETRELSKLGLHAFGMSTVPELLTAGMIGMKVLNFSMITNLASFMSVVDLSHTEVKEASLNAENTLKRLLLKLCENIKIETEEENAIQQKLNVSKCFPNYSLEHNTKLDPQIWISIKKSKQLIKRQCLQLDIPVPNTAIFLYANPTKEQAINYGEILHVFDVSSLYDFPITSLSCFGSLEKNHNAKIALIRSQYKPNQIVFMITHTNIEGFTEIEYQYLSRLLAKLKVKIGFIVFPAFESIAENGEILDMNHTILVKDYFNRVNRDIPHISSGHAHFDSSLLEKEISKNEKIVPTKDVFVAMYEAPVLPSMSERTVANNLGQSICTITNLFIHQYLLECKIKPILLAYPMEKQHWGNLFKNLASVTKGPLPEPTVFLENDMFNQFSKNLAKLNFSSSVLIPNENLFWEIEDSASQVCSHFSKMPEEAFIIDMNLFPAIHENIYIENMLTLKNANCDVCNLYKGRFKNGVKQFIFMDMLLERNLNQKSEYTILPIRVLLRAGIKRIIILDLVHSASSDLKPGAICHLIDHLPICTTSPLFGRNFKEHGERFPGLKSLYKYSNKDMVNLKKSLNEFFKSKPVYAIWIENSITEPGLSYGEVAKKMSSAIITNKGIPEALATHHMNCSVEFIGIVKDVIGEPQPMLSEIVSNFSTLLDKFNI